MYHFIVNIAGGSGKAKKTWDKVSSILDKNNIEYTLHKSEYAGHAKIIAKELSESFDECKLVVVGGDGTINEVLNGISDFSKIRFGVIPTGSGNDFSRGLKIPRHSYNIKKALNNILNSSDSKVMDLGLLRLDSGKKFVFGISSGIGMDAIVCKKTITSKLKVFLNKIHLGKLVYVILTVQTLFSMKTTNAKIKFDDEASVDINKLIFFAAMNLKAEGGGVKMAPKSVYDDDKLCSCLAYGIPKWITFFFLPLLVLGLHSKLKGFVVKKFSKAEITLNDSFTVHTDGEYIEESNHVVFECIPSKLKLLMK